MEEMMISDVVAAVEGELLSGDSGTLVTGVSTDTRTLKPGDLFFALIGEDSDGHEYVSAAFEAGASGVVVSKDVEAQGVAVLVPNTLLALGDLAHDYVSRLETTVIGVTGSVGKTTTKEMIAAVLTRRYRTLRNELNFNNEIGVPLTLLGLAREHEAAVVEMAMRLPGEIARLAEIAQPRIGVITNIGMSHIERLGSRNAIASAKAELVQALPHTGYAILPRDDYYFDFLLEACPCTIVSFGTGRNADVRAESVTIDPQGQAAFDVILPGASSFRVSLPVAGEHNVQNALAAIAVGWKLGVPVKDIKDALQSFAPLDKRANVVKSSRGCTVFDDTYNASPASVSSALSTISKMNGNRKIAVLGDMLELGDFAPEAHREIGIRAAEAGLDLLVTVGELARSIADSARDAGMECVESVDTSEEAAEYVSNRLQPRDVVLVKGSRAMQMEKVVDSLIS